MKTSKSFALVVEACSRHRGRLSGIWGVMLPHFGRPKCASAAARAGENMVPNAAGLLPVIDAIVWARRHDARKCPRGGDDLRPEKC